MQAQRNSQSSETIINRVNAVLSREVTLSHRSLTH